MQIKNLRMKSYYSWKINNYSSKKAIERIQKIELFLKLKLEGCSSAKALQAVGLSSSTFYRLKSRYDKYGIKGLELKSTRPYNIRKPKWDRHTQQLVCSIRNKYRLWGCRKIMTILQREHGIKIGESTVARILSKLLKLNRIKPVCFYYSRTKSKRRRAFKTHSKRWKYGMKSSKVGELIQVDHMSVNYTEGVTIKEFKAVCPITKIIIIKVYSRATSVCASDFLLHLKKELPYPIKSIQVDGGSEFMKEFEQNCEKLDIPLFVLPPRSPKHNGCVERANGTTRYEFYPFYQGNLRVEAMNKSLKEYQNYYNSYRPHDGIGLKTPLQYYREMEAT